MPTVQRMSKMNQVVQSRQRDITVVLEDIFDPDNVEAIFRTCDAFGIQNVHIIFDSTDPFNPRKVGKATSSSANKWIDFTLYKQSGVSSQESGIRKCIHQLKTEGYSIVATALTDKSINLYEFKAG